MPVLGFNITKMELTKEPSAVPQGEVEVQLTPQIQEVRLGEMITPTGKINGVEVVFAYEIHYNPKIAEGVVEGRILYLPNQKEQIDEYLNLWEDDRKVDPMMFAEIVNFLTVELSPAIMIMAKEMRLPYHVPLPRVELRPNPTQ